MHRSRRIPFDHDDGRDHRGPSLLPQDRRRRRLRGGGHHRDAVPRGLATEDGIAAVRRTGTAGGERVPRRCGADLHNVRGRSDGHGAARRDAVHAGGRGPGQQDRRGRGRLR